MIELEEVPELTHTVLVAAFEGWNDAGEAATAAIEHLETTWQATPVAAVDPEEYYDFQVNRPTVEIGEALTRHITWPTTRLSRARLPDGGRDVLLLHGVEPSMRWRTFCSELLGFAGDLGVEMVVSLGSLLADSPHTRPVPVTGVASDEALVRSLTLEPSSYEGPTGIVGVLQDACGKEEVPAVSLWAAVPHYVAQTPCPKATLALLSQVEDLLDVSVPLGDLPEQSRAWERGVEELASQDDEVADYVRSLERRNDETELPEASGEAIAKEFERYLRRRSQGGDPS
ncbi:MAG: PAC2 family protein [Streptosporangiaceae bacterium]